MSVFEKLNAIDVSAQTEKKSNLTYLSWAWAWGKLKENYPDAQYKVYEREVDYLLIHGEQAFPAKRTVNYFDDGQTAWVKVGVIVEGHEHIEMLPVMDHRNKSIRLNNVDSFAVNKTIQRALTKAIGRHGLGLYIYAGEDLPEPVKNEQAEAAEREKHEKALEAFNKEAQAFSERTGKNLTDLFGMISELTHGKITDVQGFNSSTLTQKAYIINEIKKQK